MCSATFTLFTDGRTTLVNPYILFHCRTKRSHSLCIAFPPWHARITFCSRCAHAHGLMVYSTRAQQADRYLLLRFVCSIDVQRLPPSSYIPGVKWHCGPIRVALALHFLRNHLNLGSTVGILCCARQPLQNEGEMDESWRGGAISCENGEY